MFVLALILIFLFFALCILFFARTKRSDEYSEESEEKKTPKIASDCCGAHETCDKNSLIDFDDKIVYYDDEELDQLADVDAIEFTSEQVEQLSEVFYTLEERDVAGWLLSLQKRRIQIPEFLRDEALLIVQERRGH